MESVDNTPNVTVFEGGEPEGSIEKMETEGGTNFADGFWFYFADGTTTFLPMADVLANFDPEPEPDGEGHLNWFIKIPVSGDTFDTAGTITYVADNDGAGGLERFDGDASADPAEDQTFYMLPVILNVVVDSTNTLQRLALGGAYEEDGFCAGNKGPIRRMIKIA